MMRHFITIQLKNRGPFIFILALLLLNVILKLLFLDARDIAMDEPFTIFYSQMDLADIFKMLPGENNPPLYFLLLHFWIKLFGISALSVRFLPFVFSVITAAMIFRIGQRFLSVKVGAVASLLYTFSNYHLIFAHETRVYSLFALLTVCSIYLFMKIGCDQRKGKATILFTFVNIFLIYSHFFGFLVIGTELLALFAIRHYREGIWKPVVISTVALFVAYLPYIPLLIARYSISTTEGTWVPLPAFSDLYTMVWRYSNAPAITVVFLCILLMGGVLLLLRNRGDLSQTSPEGKLVLVWFFVPYLLMFAVSYKTPVFLDRYTVFLSIGYYLVIAMAIESISGNKWVFGILACLSVALMLATFTPNVDNKRRLKELVQKIEHARGPGTVVIICPAWLEYGFTYHYRQDYFRDYRNLRKSLNGEGIFPVNGLSQLDTNVLKKATSVLYLEEWATLVDKDNAILNRLFTYFKDVSDEKVYESFVIHRFTIPTNYQCLPR